MFPALIQARLGDSVLADHVPYKSFELLYSDIYRKGKRPFQDEQRSMLFKPRNIRYKRLCVSLSDTQTSALHLNFHLSRSLDVASGAVPSPDCPSCHLSPPPRLDHCPAPRCPTVSSPLLCRALPRPVQFSPVQSSLRVPLPLTHSLLKTKRTE